MSINPQIINKAKVNVIDDRRVGWIMIRMIEMMSEKNRWKKQNFYAILSTSYRHFFYCFGDVGGFVGWYDEISFMVM